MALERFVEPDWGAPLDIAAYVAGIPADATIKGVFPAAVAEAAKNRGGALTNARDRYHPFSDVPLREYVPMLHECAATLFPSLPPREGLRKLGRSALDAIARSTFGRVLLTSVFDWKTSLAAVAKGASVITPGATMKVIEFEPHRAVVSMESVYTFFDSHHVGIFEKISSGANLRIRVRVDRRTAYDGKVELTW